MHICIIFSTPFPPKEGIGNYVYNLSKKVISKGHEVTLITRGGFSFEQQKYEGINVIKPVFLPIYPFHVFVHGYFVQKIFKKLEPDFDVVHIHSPLSPVIRSKLPIISTIHTPMKTDTVNFEKVGLFSYVARAQWRVSYGIEMFLLKASKIITAVSRTVAQELANEYNVKYDDVKVIYNGVDEKTFIPAVCKTEDKYILYVGSLGYRKGLFDLVECATYICKQYADINFIIVGDGVLKSKMMNMVKKHNLESRFTFKGHVSKEELINIYQNALIHVVPSHYEGLPTVLLEAMSCGLPVVATSISGNIDVISSGENGILIPPKSPEEMAKKISFLIDNASIRERLGINARRTIETTFTWDIIANNILSYYQDLVGENIW